MKYHFPDNDIIVFGIQSPDMADAVLKTVRALFLGPSQNLTETACQNDAVLVLKDNARIVFGAVSASLVDDLPNKYRC
jgi:ABC-type hemin transport system substrate-binding protein